ncbi:hypothetical protein [Nocardia sp. NPDC004604]
MGHGTTLNKVRFPSPVPAGSRIRGGADIVSIAEVPDGLRQATVEREDGD